MSEREKIYLSRACVSSEEKEALSRVIDGSYLGMGQEVKAFEAELEEYLSSPVACVCNGTSALQLAIQACGIGSGDEVIIPSITYVASFQATSATGATPIACDVDPITLCADPQDIKRRITKRTKAIMYVHYAGGVGDREAIFAIAKENNLRVIEDAAHSFGGDYNGQKIGASGDIVCFSFDGIKNITCGEGGAIVSHDMDVINKVRDLRLLGIQNDSAQRYAGKRTWDLDVIEQGWRYHMNNLCAAVGRTQLKKVQEFSQKRRTYARLYMEGLKNLPVKLLEFNLNETVPHIFPITVAPNIREDLKSFLAENGVETGFHYKPNHWLTKYKGENCPNAEAWGHSSLTLPLHCRLTEENVMFVISHIQTFFTKS